MPLGRKLKRKAGVIGMGIIGSNVAASLRHAGFQTYVWNRTPKPAPNFLGSPGDVAQACEIIQLFVSDANAVNEMIEAMASKLTPKHVIVCSSTIGMEGTLAAARKVQGYGAAFLDAPFTGSKLAAEKHQLVYYVGGEEQVFVRAKPQLEASAKALVRVGDVGDAAIIKVVTNMISAATNQSLAESLAIVKKAGLDPNVLAEALHHNAARSGVIDLKLPKMIEGNFEPHFALKHMLKDVKLGIHLAEQLGVSTPAAVSVAGAMTQATKHGWDNLDFSAVAKLNQDKSEASEAGDFEIVDES